MKIGKSGSAEGISLTGTLLELAAITVSGAYNFSQGFPFRWFTLILGIRLTSVPGSSYGESVFLAAQTSAIVILVIAFTKGKPSALLFGALYAGILTIVLPSNPVNNPLVRRRLGAVEPPHHPLHHAVVRSGCQHTHDPPRWFTALHVFFLSILFCPQVKSSRLWPTWRTDTLARLRIAWNKKEKDVEILVCSFLQSLSSFSHLEPLPGSSPPFRWAAETF